MHSALSNQKHVKKVAQDLSRSFYSIKSNSQKNQNKKGILLNRNMMLKNKAKTLFNPKLTLEVKIKKRVFPSMKDYML